MTAAAARASRGTMRLACAGVVAWLAVAALSTEVVAATPASGSSAGASQPLRFAGLRWGTSCAEVARVLAARGFAPAQAGTWRGRWLGRAAEVSDECDPVRGLRATTLRFAPVTAGDALHLYARLRADMRQRHGRPLVEIEPGRTHVPAYAGRAAWMLSVGELSAATLWVSSAQAAAAVQLDGRNVVWLRFEAPGYEAAGGERR
jgi:hypothetical protein